MKKFFLFNLIGALIISALVAVITVLIGEFNDTATRVLATLFMVILHSLVSLAFIWDDDRQNTFERLGFFSNVLFFVIVASFITSVLWIWDVLPGDLGSNLYQTFFVLGFAALHGDILAKAFNKESYLDGIIYLNYVFMAIVVAMLMPIIYLSDAMQSLGELYYRFLGAAGIVDGTLSILTIIFYKLHLKKHPREQNNLTGVGKKKGWSLWFWLFLIYLIGLILGPLLLILFSLSF